MRYADSLQVDAAEAIRVEHICLESEGAGFDGRARGTLIGPALAIASPFRGCRTELALLDGHRLAVRTQRSRSAAREYVVDLRFLDDQPVTRRCIAWRCWVVSAALVALAATGDWLAGVPGIPPWLQSGPLGPVLLLLAASGVGGLALYRTREVLQFHSVHGRAILVEIVGNIGCARAATPFATAVARSAAEARARAAQSRQRYLCDELHEHRRLLGEGVLSQAAYEAGKQRILQAHA